MKRWFIILVMLAVTIALISYGKQEGNVPETQHNGASLCLSCIGVGE